MFTHVGIVDYRRDFTVRSTIVHVAKVAQLEIDTHRRRIQPTLDLSAVMPFTTHLRSGSKAGPQRSDVLWQVFKLIAYAKCIFPKDRVFGILALPCLPRLGIEHDSKASLIQVYGELAAACMNAGQDPLAFLSLVDGVTNELDNERRRHGELNAIEGEQLPSWVPDLSSERETGLIEGTFRAGYPPGYEWNLLAEDGWEDVGARPEIRLGPDRILYLEGFVTDAVDGLGGIAWAHTDTESDYGNLRFSSDLSQPKKTPPRRAELISHRAAICACLTAGTDENGARLRRGHEDIGLLRSFLVDMPFADASQYFVEANWTLNISGVPIKDYLSDAKDLWLRWTGSVVTHGP